MFKFAFAFAVWTVTVFHCYLGDIFPQFSSDAISHSCCDNAEQESGTNCPNAGHCFDSILAKTSAIDVGLLSTDSFLTLISVFETDSEFLIFLDSAQATCTEWLRDVPDNFELINSLQISPNAPPA